MRRCHRGDQRRALFVLAGLVVDLGIARDTRRQSQIAADASALAAANVLYPGTSCAALNPSGTDTPPCLSDAVSAARSYAETNYAVSPGDWASCPAPPSGFSAVSGAPQCISFDDLLAPTRVWMVMPARRIAMTFGVVAGVDHVDVGARARAVVAEGGRAECGLCLLGGGLHYLQNGDVTVSGTSVQANGNLVTQQVNGHVTVTDGSVRVEGVASGNIFPPAIFGAGHLLDPLDGIVLPAASNNWFGTPTTPRPKSDVCTDGPGFYDSSSVPVRPSAPATSPRGSTSSPAHSA